MLTVRVRGLLCRTASACGVSTGAVLGRGCLHARCVQTVLGSRRAENCDFSQLQSWPSSTVVDVLCLCNDVGALAGGASAQFIAGAGGLSWFRDCGLLRGLVVVRG